MPDNAPNERTEVPAESSRTIPQPPPGQTTVVSGFPTPADTVLPRISNYELLRRIGRGAYGEVWLARSVVGAFHAVKVVYRNSFETDRPYEREFAGIQKFEPISRSHPGLVNILHVGRDDEAGYFYYVMELADDAKAVFSNQCSVISDQTPVAAQPRGEAKPLNTENCLLNTTSYGPRTLSSDLKHRGRLPPEDCVQIGLALTRALGYLHEQGLVHRDIKPANIIFVKGAPKLADIGLVCGTEGTVSYVGTEGYIPPEGPGTPQADLYSLGKVFYEMSTGKDRQDFPDLPTDLRGEGGDREALLEWNEVVVKACAGQISKRYRTALEMEAELATLQSGASVKRQRTVRQRRAGLKLVGVAAALVALLVLIKVELAGRRSSAVAEPQSIAVLPFGGRSGKGDQDSYVIGLTDTLINKLAGIRSLDVRSLQRVMAYAASTNQTTSEISRELGVQFVVRGLVQRSEGRLAINVQLIRANSETPIWTERFDQSESHALKLQSDVAEKLLRAIQVQLSPQEQRRLEKAPSVKPEALALYFTGQGHLRRENPKDIDIAISLLQKAVQAEPSFSDAHAELANAYVVNFFYFEPTNADWKLKATAEVKTALALDRDSAQAHNANGHLIWMPSPKDFPHEQAIQELRLSLTLNPNLDEAHQWLAMIYLHIGLLDQALREAHKAIEINPSNFLAHYRVGVVLHLQGKYEAALAALEPIPYETNPELLGRQISWTLFQLGKYEAARSSIKGFKETYKGDAAGQVVSIEAMLDAVQGKPREAEEKIQRALQKRGPGHFHHTAYQIACAYSLLNKPAEAVQLLKDAANTGFPCYPLFKNDANLKNLHDYPPYASLLSELKKHWEVYQKKYGPPSP